MSAVTRMTEAEWRAEGVRRFGENTDKWRFVCPACGNVAAIEDYRAHKDAGARPNSATCECIGRYLQNSRAALGENAGDAPSKPCDYAGYGLFRLSPVLIARADGHEECCFAFADSETEAKGEDAQ